LRWADSDRALPLINVAFLLLAFVMLTGRLVAPDPFPIAPPRSDSAATPGQGPTRVALARDGRLALDGTAMALSDLAAAVGARVAATPELAVRIDADGGADATALVDLLAALRASGVAEARLTTAPAL
jgi:biopolymer transport protein ExbD